MTTMLEIAVQTVVAATLVLIIVYRCYPKVFMSTKRPPGPPGVPILGNALDLAPGFGWKIFEKWREQYGEC